MEPDKFYFEDSKKLWETFRNLLQTGYGNIKQNSKLAQIADDVASMFDLYLDRSKYDRKQDYRSRWRKVIGLNDIVRKIMQAHQLPEFSNVWPLTEHFLDEHSAIVQNDTTPFNDDSANKLFELFIALMLVHFASNIKIDSSNGKDGKHPDLTFEFDGLKWAIECKTPGSGKVKAYKDKVLEGVQQIDTFKFPIDRGFVAVNMRNAIDHDSFWPLKRCDDGEIIPVIWRNYDYAFEQLKSWRPSNEEIKEDFGGSEAKRVVASWKRARPFVFNFYSSAAAVLDPEQKPILGNFRTFDPVLFEPLDSKDDNLLRQLQEALHDRL